MSFHRKQILAVDDDPDLLDVYEDLLSSDTVDVHTANDGLEGIKMIEKNRYDVIITDVKMPRIHGLQFVSCVKVSPLNNQTPVFVISSELFGDNLAKLQTMGIVDRLDKPLDYDQLTSKISTILNPDFKQPIGYDPEIIQLIKDSAQKICSFYFGHKAKVEKPFIYRGYDPYGTATGVINLFGHQVYGMLSVSCDQKMILSFAEQLFGESTAIGSNLDFSDLVGEMANQFAGNVKKALAEKDILAIIGIPFVLKGDQHKIPACVASPKVAIQMSLNEGSFRIEFALGDPQHLQLRKQESEARIFIYDKDRAA